MKTLLVGAAIAAFVLVNTQGHDFASAAQFKPVIKKPRIIIKPDVTPQTRKMINKDPSSAVTKAAKQPAGSETVKAGPQPEPPTSKVGLTSNTPLLPRLRPYNEFEEAENTTNFDNPDFARNAARIAELAGIGLFKEHIGAIQDMLNISGLDGTQGVPGIDEWGANPNGDGNPINIPGADEGPLDGSSNNTDSGGRLGAGVGPDYSDVASDLAGRHSTDPYSGMGGEVVAPPSPSDALSGIASQASPTERWSNWQRDDSGDKYRTGSFSLWISDPATGNRTTIGTGYRVETSSLTGRYTTHHDVYNDGTERYWVTEGAVYRTEKGSGDAKDIAKQQDPYSGGGVVVWVPPNCGSADCNSVRDLLKNPKGSLLQAIGKGARVHGDREGSGTGTTHYLTIDQHGLVVSYGADSGPPGADGGRVQRFDKSKFQSD